MGVDWAQTRFTHTGVHMNLPHINTCTCTKSRRKSSAFLEPQSSGVGYIGFSYYFQGGQLWSPSHACIGVVSSLITTDIFPLLFPVSWINRISNCLVQPHQKKNMIYEISSHEKAILGDYLLITQTAQLTDKGERGDVYWKRDISRTCEGGSKSECICIVVSFLGVCPQKEKLRNRFRETQSDAVPQWFQPLVLLSQSNLGYLSNQTLLDAFTSRSQETKTVSSNIHTITLSPSRGCRPLNSSRNSYSSKRLCPGPA